jgi:tetratricopeptide (TPR) repeat protein
MFSTSANQEDQFKVASPEARFEVGPPNTDPLVASVPASVMMANDRPAIAWNSESVDNATVHRDPFLNDVADRVKKDTLRFPRSVRAHTNFGIVLAKSGRVQEAIDELQMAISIDPNYYLACVTLAQLLAKEGRLGEAKVQYKHLVDRPNNDSVLLSLAYIALQENRLPEAEAYLEQTLRDKKRLAFPSFLLGITRLQRGNPHGAVAALRDATKLGVRTSAYHHALAVAYAMGGDYARAERSFKTALALSPDVNYIVHGLSEVFLEQGKSEDVVGLLKPYVDRHEDDITGRELLARAYVRLSKYGTARSLLKSTLDKFHDRLTVSERSRFLTNIAITLLADGLMPSAEGELKRAIELNPEWSHIPYETLGRAYLGAERFEDAVYILRRAKTLFPTQQSVRILLSQAYSVLDLFDKAIGELLPFCDAGTAEAETSSMLGSLYDWNGDYDSALCVLKNSFECFPTNLGVINNLAYSYLMLGQVKEARAVLSSMPLSAKPHVELIATQGLLRLLEGNRVEGARLYQKAQNLARDSGRHELVKRVRQKMHLEFARVAAKSGDVETALREIKRGLALRLTGQSYRKHLEELRSAVSKGE